MKTLHLIRHGKSSWEQPGVADIDRALLPKGIVNSTLVAERIVALFGVPDKILSSPASRAIHTALIMARTMHFDESKVCIVPSIYESNTSNILEVIETTVPEINSLAIVGHNPTFTDFANLYLPDYLDNMPTSCVVTFKFDIKDWNIIDKMPVSSHIEFPKKDYF